MVTSLMHVGRWDCGGKRLGVGEQTDRVQP